MAQDSCCPRKCMQCSCGRADFVSTMLKSKHWVAFWLHYPLIRNASHCSCVKCETNI